MELVGITEYNDALFDNQWEKWTLEKRKPTILLTKNIIGLCDKYPNILNQPNILFHIGITGYGGSLFEPGVPAPRTLLNFLSNIKNKSNIVCRIDPIIPIEKCINQSLAVFDECVKMGYKRFRISILDLYPHVLYRFNKYHELQYELKVEYNWDQSHSLGEHKEYMIHAPFSRRSSIIQQFIGIVNSKDNSNIELAVCCEPGFDAVYCKEISTDNVSVINDGCVSRKDLSLLNITPEKRYIKNDQRQFCQCLGIKKELCKTHECENFCLYCYWRKKEEKLVE
jgi:hypothetical protein